jgi:competence protein ComEA
VGLTVRHPGGAVPYFRDRTGDAWTGSLVIGVALLAGALLRTEPGPVPSRVVHLPGVGWVDADAAEPPIDPVFADGAELRWTTAAEGPGVEIARTAILPVAETLDVETGAAAMAFGRPISVNRATARQLDRLPGIGPVLAERIVAGRPYATVDELDRVKGIGPATLDRIRPYVAP